MHHKNSGFTMVEILIVVAIISLLLQLALPAALMSREAARKITCKNNLRQIGMACQAHLSSVGQYPTGGWGFSWAGDSERGADKSQPGGWVFNLLPYMEQQALYGLNKGNTINQKMEGATTMCRTPLPIFSCPSRRRVKLYPFDDFERFPMRNTFFLEKAAKSDYAANAGDYFSSGIEGPESLSEGDSPTYDWTDPKYPEIDPFKSTGIIYKRSEVTPAFISDGLSHTYLVGEKYLNPDHYKDGADGGDDHVMYGGFDPDINRFSLDDDGTLIPPRQDEKGDSSRYLFGSAHLNSCNMAYCDGSVREISYSVDGDLHRSASNRHDAVLSP